jgi:hypothetical protein
MLRMVSYSRRPQSGHIVCYLNRTYHVLTTAKEKNLDAFQGAAVSFAVWGGAFPAPE